MMWRIFILSFAFLPQALAADAVPNGAWKLKGQEVKISDKEVRFGDEEFPIGKETIVDAWGNTSPEWVAKEHSECRIKTHLAHRAPSGEIVLLEMTRSRPSGSKGLLCKLTRHPGNFDKPYHFVQIVLKPGANGDLSVRVVEVRDGSGRPALSVEELKKPGVHESNAKLRKYFKENSAPPFRKAFVNDETATRKSEGGGSEESAGDEEERDSATGI